MQEGYISEIKIVVGRRENCCYEVWVMLREIR